MHKNHFTIMALPILLYLGIGIPLVGMGQSLDPLHEPVTMSGNFGELRSHHFHSGIDIRTGGEGKPVYAVKDGWLVRLKVSNTGYGKVLYVNHYDGTTSVYAHLHSFNEQLEKMASHLQVQCRNYEVEKFFPADSIIVCRNDLLALSGNTGGSDGPHLHFEIRDTPSEEVINPLLKGIIYHDSIQPAIEQIHLYALHDRRWIRFQSAPTNDIHHQHYFTTSPLNALGVAVIDRDSLSHLGIYSLKLFADDTLIFAYDYNHFSFRETNFADAHNDPEAEKEWGYPVERLFRLSGDTASLFKNAGAGLINLSVKHKRIITVEAADYSGNCTSYNFTLEWIPETKAESDSVDIIPFDKLSVRFNSGCKVTFPEGALYQDQPFFFRSGMKGRRVYFELMNELTVFRYPVTITFNREINEHIYVAAIDKDNKKKGAYLLMHDQHSPAFQVKQGGTFMLEEDSVAPIPIKTEIKKDEVDGIWYAYIRIEENGSGIDHYDLMVNHQDVYPCYDSRIQSLVFPLKNTMAPFHFQLTISDRVNNHADYHWVY